MENDKSKFKNKFKKNKETTNYTNNTNIFINLKSKVEKQVEWLNWKTKNNK